MAMRTSPTISLARSVIMIQRKRTITPLIFLVLVGFLGISKLSSNDISFLVQRNKPLLAKGDRICYFDITGEKGTFKKSEILDNGYTLIIIFSNNCFSCNKNIPIWNRIALLTGLKVFGIILNNEKLSEFSSMNIIRFALYSPIDLNKFKENFEANEAIDYTILCKGDEVIYFHMGSLSIDNYFQIRNIIGDN